MRAVLANVAVTLGGLAALVGAAVLTGRLLRRRARPVAPHRRHLPTDVARDNANEDAVAELGMDLCPPAWRVSDDVPGDAEWRTWLGMPTITPPHEMPPVAPGRESNPSKES